MCENFKEARMEKARKTRAKVLAAVLAVALTLEMMPQSAVSVFAEQVDPSVSASTDSGLGSDETTSPSALNTVAMPLTASTNTDKFLVPIDPPMEGAIPIATKADLEAIKDNPNGNYYLTANINLLDDEWSPIGTPENPFSGTFDGQGFVISNLHITNYSNYVGLFGYSSSGVIKNIDLENTDINIHQANLDLGECFIGSIVGSGYKVTNCYSDGSINIDGVNEWALNIGSTAGLCSDLDCCTNYTEIRISIPVMTADNGGAYLAGEYNVGGITGATGSISNCYNFANISVTPSSDIAPGSTSSVLVGGIIGSGARSRLGLTMITDCHNSGDVESVGAAGGIAGDAGTLQRLKDCSNNGKIDGFNAAGMAWLASGGEVTNNYNSGSISSPYMAAGLIALNDSNISDCYNTGTVSATNNNDVEVIAGGIAAGNDSTIQRCYNSGDILASSATGDTYAGGICGRSGFISSNWTTKVINCAVMSNHISSSSVPGHYYYDTVCPSYDSSAIYNNNFVMIGASNTDWLTQYVIRPSDDFSTKSFYTDQLGWDFNTVWTMPEVGWYPILQWQDEGTAPTPTPPAILGSAQTVDLVAQGKSVSAHWGSDLFNAGALADYSEILNS